MKLRHDYGTRVAGQKAELIDEFVTRSQFVQGPGINLLWNDNNDLIISSSVLQGGGGKEFRVIIGKKKIYSLPQQGDAGFERHQPAYTGTNATLPDGNGTYYNYMMFFDIIHNWNLIDKNSYIFQYWTPKFLPYTTAPTKDEIDIFVRVIPINTNKIRIYYGTPIFVDRPNKWTNNIIFENNNNQFISEHDLIIYDSYGNEDVEASTRILMFKLIEIPNPDILQYRSNT